MPGGFAMAFRLLPREEAFFTSFLDQAQVIQRAANLLLRQAGRDGGSAVQTAAAIAELEHRGDRITHDVLMRLNRTFITPLDPEDIHTLSSALDDVLDGIEDSAHRLAAYRISDVPSPAVELCGVLVAASAQIQQALEALKESRSALPHCIEINRLENEADRIVRTAIADLFDRETDALQSIVVKNS